MRAIEIEFLDTYKETDSLCNEAFNCERGISDYIGKMSDLYNEGNAHIEGWKEELSTLKRLRRLRNKIAHESGKSECNKNDLQDLKKFRNKLKKRTDVLSQLKTRKQKKGNGKLVAAVIIGLIVLLVVLYLCHMNGIL